MMHDANGLHPTCHLFCSRLGWAWVCSKAVMLIKQLPWLTPVSASMK